MMKTTDMNSVVLITGASAGIGKALAFAFARDNKNLLLIALPNTGLEEVAETLRVQFNINVHCYCIDLTKPEAPQEIFNWCRNNFFKVQVLVNNAGFGNLESFENTSPLLLHNMMHLNNIALVMLTHFFIPELKKFSQSYILNVGSLAAFMPIPNKALYAATKSFVYAFSHSLYFELKQASIHVGCLCPGGTLTERVQHLMDQKKVNRRGFCQRPEAVAAEGIRGLYQKQFRIIPGRQNRFLYWLSQILPEVIKMLIIRIAFRPANQLAVDNQLTIDKGQLTT